VINYVKDLDVKIKKITDCDMFLSMLYSNFDVEIWSPVEQTLLEVVALFLADGTNVQWTFLWGRSYLLHNPIRNFHNLFSMIPDSTHDTTRCLQFDFDAKTTARFPSPLKCPKFSALGSPKPRR
jgi:hypothetical protein